MIALRRTRFDTPCRVEVEHSDEFLCAHVELAGGVAVGPGDRVRVHGAPISVGFGERRVVDASPRSNAPARSSGCGPSFAGHFEMTELYEVSFSAIGPSMNAHTAIKAAVEQGRHAGHRARGHRALPALLHHRFRGDGPDRRVARCAREWDALIAEMASRPQPAPLQAHRGVRRRDRKPARWPARGVHRFPRQLADRRILRLHPLCRDRQARDEPRHQAAVQADEPRREPPCRLHQRHAQGCRHRHRSRLPDARPRNTPISGRNSSSTRPISARRSAMRATSRSSAISRRIPSCASTRSSTGSSCGATTSSATATPSRS